jgi:hypothetical protein
MGKVCFGESKKGMKEKNGVLRKASEGMGRERFWERVLDGMRVVMGEVILFISIHFHFPCFR